MKAFNDYEKTEVLTEQASLPADGYICEIVNAKVSAYPYKDNSGMFEKLEIAIDIAEGEFKGYYKQNFEAQTAEDKKWKGVLRQFVPTDDGSDKDNYTKRIFKSLIYAIEESNPSFHWDWDEKKLKGLKVGCIFREEEWQYNGKQGWKAQPYKFVEASKIREGKFKVPSRYSKYTNSSAAVPGAPVPMIDEDDLPF